MSFFPRASCWGLYCVRLNFKMWKLFYFCSSFFNEIIVHSWSSLSVTSRFSATLLNKRKWICTNFSQRFVINWDKIRECQFRCLVSIVWIQRPDVLKQCLSWAMQDVKPRLHSFDLFSLNLWSDVTQFFSFHFRNPRYMDNK